MEQNNAHNDEIDLYELFQKLYNQRWIILGIMAWTPQYKIHEYKRIQRKAF
jgi:hypothetical protein